VAALHEYRLERKREGRKESHSSTHGEKGREEGSSDWKVNSPKQKKEKRAAGSVPKEGGSHAVIPS